MKKVSAMILVLTLAACGGSGSGSGDSEFSDKNLAITVSNSASFSEDSFGHIDYYLLTVSADDMDPVTEMVGGDATGGTVLGVPSGEHRVLTVLAYNDHGQVIRRAVKEGITVMAGRKSMVEARMESVPVFMTRDNLATSNNRLNFGIFGEPGSSLIVSRVDGEEETQLVDASTNVSYVETSSEDGFFSFDPGTLEYGNYIFKIEDIETHESSILSIALYKSLARPGMTLGSGGTLRKIHDELVISNIGGAFHQNTSNRVNTTGIAPFLQQLENIYEE